MMKPIYNSRDLVHHKVLRTLISISAVLILLSVPYKLIAEGEQTSIGKQKEKANSNQKGEEGLIVCEHADFFEQDEETGLTILTGSVRIRQSGGFLNADKVTLHRNLETGEYKKTVAVGNVEMRDKDIFATCEHAVIDHVEDIVELSKNVVVLQNEDRLEAKQFMFNRRTGKRTGKGDVKFRVRISSNSQGDSDASSNKSE